VKLTTVGDVMVDVVSERLPASSRSYTSRYASDE